METSDRIARMRKNIRIIFWEIIGIFDFFAKNFLEIKAPLKRRRFLAQLTKKMIAHMIGSITALPLMLRMWYSLDQLGTCSST